MSGTPGVNYQGTKAPEEEFSLDSVNFDAVEEANAAKIDSQEEVEADNDCGGACTI